MHQEDKTASIGKQLNFQTDSLGNINLLCLIDLMGLDYSTVQINRQNKNKIK